MLPKTSAANSRGCGENRRSGKTAAGWENVQGTAKREASCHHQPTPPPGRKIPLACSIRPTNLSSPCCGIDYRSLIVRAVICDDTGCGDRHAARLEFGESRFHFFKSAAISANCASAACKSSTISWAMISGGGRLALSSKAFILTQDVEVDFVAHRNASSNVKNLRRDSIPALTSQGGKHPSQLSGLERAAYSLLHSHNVCLELSTNVGGPKALRDRVERKQSRVPQERSVALFYLIPERRPLTVTHCGNPGRSGLTSRCQRRKVGPHRKPARGEILLNYRTRAVTVPSPRQQTRRVIREKLFQCRCHRIDKLVLLDPIPHVKNKDTAPTKHSMRLRERLCLIRKEHDTELADYVVKHPIRKG